MSNGNQLLAKIIEEKLKEKKLIVDSDNQIMMKLATGLMKDVDWKLAIEESIIQVKSDSENET